MVFDFCQKMSDLLLIIINQLLDLFSKSFIKSFDFGKIWLNS